MATWEDGPEYAPLERPAGFDGPAVAALDVAPAVPHLAALAPKERPAFSVPPVPVPPLAMLVPPVEDTRDPQQPFDVVSATLTSDSAWSSAHWNRPPGSPVAAAGPPPVVSPPWAPAPTDPAAGPWGPPVGMPWPAPEQPLGVSGPPPGTNGFPAPGTPQWFGTGSYPPPTTATRPTMMHVFIAATTGLCVVLGIGGLILPLSPIMIAIGFGLSGRVRVAKQPVRALFIAAVSLVGLVALIGAFTNETGFADWWHVVGVWSLILCWASLVAVLVLVHRALSTGGSPPPTRTPWG